MSAGLSNAQQDAVFRLNVAEWFFSSLPAHQRDPHSSER
jgi:hypothetical protein